VAYVESQLPIDQPSMACSRGGSRLSREDLPRVGWLQCGLNID